MARIGNAIRILLVDDSPGDSRLFAEAAQAAGFQGTIQYAFDGVTALEQLDSHANDIDIIVSDLNMPRMNGFELLRHIKSRPDTRKIPVVILSTSHRHSDIIMCTEAGAAIYLTKPQDIKEYIDITDGIFSFYNNVVCGDV
ncbi:response regulator [Magnetospirillum sp. SS-4]|uniref:response regulator n=1 Tax=Magnetospirillum sp. SS-4 TaxID=2681465 RepID=UPI001572FEF4